MNFKKLSIILSIALFVFTNSISTSFANNISAPPPINNEYIKDLEIIDNNMYLLIKSIVTGEFSKNEVNKDIKYIEALINDLTLKTSKLAQKDNDVILSMQSILNYYKISIINLKKYINNKDADALIDAITSFSLGYNSSSSLRKIIGQVK